VNLEEQRIRDARDYLEDWLRDEDVFGDESLDWFDALAVHVANLSLSDTRVMLAAVALQPFLDDDDRIDCTMYPDGSAIRYVEETGWGSDYDAYLTGFVDALAQDWQRWRSMVDHDGEDAAWRLDDLGVPEEPKLVDLLHMADTLPPSQAITLHPSAQPRHPSRQSSNLPAIPPAFESWADYLDRTSLEQRIRWCRTKAAKANGARLMSTPPATKITWRDVLAVLDRSHGRCVHCHSLAVENRPSTSTGAPAPWEHVGRRIGSLGHRTARFDGGTNSPDNLCWSCLWCNTWPKERRIGATDHGGHFPG
jgi:hypothetical protein